MTKPDRELPLAIMASDVAARRKGSAYPEAFLARVAGREKRVLGDLFGLANFGVNLTRLDPGSESSLLHRHSRQDEFIFVLEGTPTLVTDAGEIELKPGMCAGFAAGGRAHHIVNRSSSDAVFLEIGDRTPGDEGEFPADNIKAVLRPDGIWEFRQKDGSPFNE